MELKELQASISEMNPTALQLTCQHSQLDITQLLNIKAFDPSTNKALLHSEQLEKTSQRNILIQRDSNGKILEKKVRWNQKRKKNSSTSMVATVSLTTTEAIDLHAFNEWISTYLQSDGDKVFRLKGILNMQGFDHQFVVQGVHMIFDGQLGPLWKDNDTNNEDDNTNSKVYASNLDSKSGSSISNNNRNSGRSDERRSRLVFIGRELDANALEMKFLECIASRHSSAKNKYI